MTPLKSLDTILIKLLLFQADRSHILLVKSISTFRFLLTPALTGWGTVLYQGNSKLAFRKGRWSTTETIKRQLLGINGCQIRIAGICGTFVWQHPS